MVEWVDEGRGNGFVKNSLRVLLYVVLLCFGFKKSSRFKSSVPIASCPFFPFGFESTGKASTVLYVRCSLVLCRTGRIAGPSRFTPRSRPNGSGDPVAFVAVAVGI